MTTKLEAQLARCGLAPDHVHTRSDLVLQATASSTEDRRDIFALPEPSPNRTRAIKAASEFIRQQQKRRSDPRDIIKAMVERHGAKLSYPSYRTAFRCGDIYSEGAAACELATARLLLNIFATKAARYLADVGCRDLFDYNSLPT